MATKFKVEYITNPDINDTEKALISSLELALIEDLNGDNRGVLYCATVIAILIKRECGNMKSITYMSKLSFQYGLRVFFMTLVVCVCSASTVMTAKGSGRRKTSRLESPSAATTIWVLVSLFCNAISETCL
jgi:hypothetical protein